MRVQDRLFLLVMSAGRNPDGPLAEVAPSKLPALVRKISRQLDVELDVACHPGAYRACSQRPEALRIGLTLRCDNDAVRQCLSKQRQQLAVLVHRPRRYARAHQHQRYLSRAASLVKIRPDFGLHDERQLGFDAREESVHGQRHLERYVAMRDRVAEICDNAGCAGRRNRRNQRWMIWEPLLDGPHERHGRLDFADRYGVNPDALFELGVAQAKTLADPVAVTAIEQRADTPVSHRRNLQQVDKQVVEKPHACVR